MPAIHLARLKIQAGTLRDSFSSPQAFVRSLHHVLVFYANRTHRHGQSGKPSPLIHAYNVPRPVLKQIIQEISPLVEDNIPATLELADHLWEQENLECRTMAITLLGMLPVDQPNPILERVVAWLPVSEEKLTGLILSQGLSRLQQEARPHYLKTIESWIRTPDWQSQQISLRALKLSLQDTGFEDLPWLFRLITPLVRNTPSNLKTDLLQLLNVLVQKSPKETAYFLKQNLPFPDTPGLLRKVMREFPDAEQENLKKSLKNPLPPL
jgi:hypothetical protein